MLEIGLLKHSLGEDSSGIGWHLQGASSDVRRRVENFVAYEVQVQGIARRDDLYLAAAAMRGDALIEIIGGTGFEISWFRLDYGFSPKSAVRSHKGLFYEHRTCLPAERIVHLEIVKSDRLSLLGGLVSMTPELTREVFLSHGAPQQNVLVLSKSKTALNESYLLKLMDCRAGADERCWIDYPRLVDLVCGSGGMVAKITGDSSEQFVSAAVFCSIEDQGMVGQLARHAVDRIRSDVRRRTNCG